MYVLYMYLSERMHASHTCRQAQRPEEGVESPGTGILDSCEVPGVGAGNLSQDLCRKCS